MLVVCLPFFAAAPIRMWDVVVTYQLVRHRLATSTPRRLAEILGLGPHNHHFHTVSPFLITAPVLVVVVLAASSWVARGACVWYRR